MMNEFRRMATAMDQRMRQLAAEGVAGTEVLYRMIGHEPDSHRIWTETSDQQLRERALALAGSWMVSRSPRTATSTT